MRQEWGNDRLHRLDLFVGRQEEQATLGAELAATRAPCARLVLVEGEAGMGKSALLRRFLTTHAGPIAVSRAVGEPSEATVPYGLLSQIWPALAVADGQRVPAPTDVGAHVLRLLWEGRKGLADHAVLVVDDAHWADDLSIQALVFALRRMRVDPVLAVLAARPHHNAGLSAAVEPLVGLGTARRLFLAPMTARETADLCRVAVGRELSPAASHRLWEHTLGSPLHASALLSELAPSVLDDLERPLPAPRSYSELVTDRMGRCSSPARLLVSAVAVLGQEVRAAEAALVAGIGDPASAVDEAARLGLLERRPGWRIACPHPLVAAAVYDALEAVVRVALHQAAAAHAAGEAAELRHRVAASLLPDRELADRLKTFARRQAELGGHSVSAQAFSDAFEQSAHSDQEALLSAIEQQLLAGAVAHANHLLSTCVEADSPRAVLLRGWLAQMEGRPAEAEALLTRAWGLAPQDPLIGGRAAQELARLAAMRGRGSDGVIWGRRVLHAAGPGSRPSAGMLVIGLCQSGRLEEAEEVLGRLPAVTGVPSAADVEEAYARGVTLTVTGDLHGAVRALRQVAAWTAVDPFGAVAVAALAWLSDAQYRLGSWDEAHAVGDLAITRAEDAGHLWMLGSIRSLAAAVLSRRGEWEVAENQVRRARQEAKLIGGFQEAYASVASARLEHTRGDYPRLLESTEALCGQPFDSAASQPGVFDWRALRAEALVRVGRLDDARLALEHLSRDARARSHHPTLASSYRVRGLLQAAVGDDSAAVAAFASALQHHRVQPVPFDRGLARLFYGEFLRTRKRDREAAHELECALAQFVSLNARPYVERATRQLRLCGFHPVAAGAERLHDRLTAQELAVARLVMKGMSNREAAARLVISIKTVEYHLQNIYTKLNVRSRTEMAHRLSSSLG